MLQLLSNNHVFNYKNWKPLGCRNHITSKPNRKIASTYETKEAAPQLANTNLWAYLTYTASISIVSQRQLCIWHCCSEHSSYDSFFCTTWKDSDVLMLLHSTEDPAQCSTTSQTELWASTMNSSNQHRTLDSLTPMTIANTGEKPAAGAQAAPSHCFFPTPAAYRTRFLSGMNPSQEDAPLAMVNTALPKRRCCWTSHLTSCQPQTTFWVMVW